MLLIIVITILSFASTLIFMPKLIEGLTERGVLVRDYYKIRKTYIPDKGGLALMFACALMISLFPILAYVTRQIIGVFDIDFLKEPYILLINDAIVMTLLLFGIFGLMDDYVDIGRPLKILIPIVLTSPMIINLRPDHLTLPFAGVIDLQDTVGWVLTYRFIFRFMVIPIYIIVAANLVNMHSGYNGLATGTTLIILVTLIIKSHVESFTADIVAIGAITGALLALWLFNKYPSKIIEGNTGALMMGSAIGITIVTKGYLIAGFVMLIPHTINFLLYVYWRIQRLRFPRRDEYKAVKFGKIRKDGTIKVPNRMTLKWILPYYIPMTEKQTVLAMYGLTFIFCLIGFFIPY